MEMPIKWVIIIFLIFIISVDLVVVNIMTIVLTLFF